MRNTKNVIEFWKKLEFFQPFYPTISKSLKTLDDITDYEPWNYNNENIIFTLYCGEILNDKLFKLMYKALDEEEMEIEVDSTKNTLFTFKVDPSGKYINGSFKLAPFIWIISQIIKEKTLMFKVDMSLYEEFNRNINLMLYSEERYIDSYTIREVQEIILNRLSLLTDIEFKVLINKRKMSDDEEKDYEKNEELEDISSEIFTSFYVEDLDEVLKYFTKNSKINRYISGELPRNEKININNDIKRMKVWTMPDKYPLGKWPSIYSASLMQQLAINIATSKEEDIFSVNGPPGTGKTTLIKDIVASNIVERAVAMLDYKYPDDAFREVKFQNSQNKYINKYYMLDEKIGHYGVIVASNNNAAVENISMELPKIENIERNLSGLFSDSENLQVENYFKKLSDRINECEDSWGLISARLGSKKNISVFTNAIWFDKEVSIFNKGDKECDKEAISCWNKAKEKFKITLSKVEKERKKIKFEIKKIEEFGLLLQGSKKIEEELSKLNLRMEEAKEKIIKSNIDYNNHCELIILIEDKVMSIKSQIRLWHKILSIFGFKFDVIDNFSEAIKERDFYINEKINTKKRIVHLEKVKSDIKIEIENKSEKLSIDRNEIKKLSNEINDFKHKYRTNMATDDFWYDIENNLISQKSCPWTYPEYDKLREELFYEALMLSKSFILNSKSIKYNISSYININDLSVEDKRNSMSHLINTIQLIVPVVSTTFASVANFLKGAKEDSLGLLVIDEAGQATPQSALGAIWRSKKTIVVGDPLQVEPIDVVPKQLKNIYINEYMLDSKYAYKGNSVQTFADQINKYGGSRNINDKEFWLGCPLIIHRRCLNPMFSISNEIAYDNVMFKETNPASKMKEFAIKNSSWYHVEGSSKGNKNHYVENQAEKAWSLIRNYHENNGYLPDIYIISPFKSVVKGIKRHLRNEFISYNSYSEKKIGKKEVEDMINQRIGTVHTFQGKEADEVLLVLGCDKKSGIGAANWVASSPNILNVAVTRAKYRLGIIGDYNLWKNISYFDVITEKLNTEYSDTKVDKLFEKTV